MKDKRTIFFLVGAAKSGTSSLYEYLKSHPDIHMCPHKDVTCYFCRHYGLPITFDEYTEMLLPPGNYLAAGDACHAYMTDNKSAELIYDVYPEARIIMQLRNPVDKAFSQYNWLVCHGYEHIATFEQALEAEDERFKKNIWKVKGLSGYRPNYLYFRSGLYAEQISRYLKYFPAEQIMFIKFEDFAAETMFEMNRIYRFLGVEPSPDKEYSRYNFKKKVRSIRLQFFLGSKLGKILPPNMLNFLMNCNSIKGTELNLSPQTREILLRKYKKNILRTQEITGLDLKDWLE